MKKLILIGTLLIVFGVGSFTFYHFSLDRSPGASPGFKPLVAAIPLLGPALMGLILVGLGIAGLGRNPR